MHKMIIDTRDKPWDEPPEEPTAVVFRRYPDGEIIALFPGIKDPRRMVSSYLHVGQHGAADYGLVISQTTPAKPEEYKDLAEELTAIGYNLKIYKRRPAE